MRLTDFWGRLTEVLGPSYVRSWAADVVLPDLGCTVDDALRDGVEAGVVWRAVCGALEVPAHLR